MSVPPNPFIGLRSFERNEGPWFFGRDPQIAELLEILDRSRFVAVVGSSGCGKSSLVRAGLLPALEGSFIVPDRDQWQFVTMMPGSAPLKALARCILDVGAPPGRLVEEAATRQLCADIQISRARALVPLIKDRLGATANLMLVVDQFEELFSFGRYSDQGATAREECEQNQAEAAQFVDTLLGLAHIAGVPVYVVLTMRSDSIGLCEVFRGLPEAVGRNLYLVPRLVREHQREAIEGPVLFVGAKIDPALVERLVNDSGGEADKLPVLQHALKRTWEVWQAAGANGPIREADYQSAGTITKALELDAEAALEKCGDARLAARVFQALTVTDAANRTIRRPTSLSALAEIAGAPDVTAITAIVAPFLERSLLRNIAGAGEPKYDLTHESLIPLWPTLSKWVALEADAAEVYRRLIVKARLWKAGREELWSRPEQPQFGETDLWWRERSPTAAWARQYGGDIDIAREFLENSRRAVAAEAKRRHDAAVANVEQERAQADAERVEANRRLAIAEREQRQKAAQARRNRRLAVGFGLLLMLAVVSMVLTVAVFWTAHRDRSVTELLKTARRDGNLVFAAEAHRLQPTQETLELLANQVMATGGRNRLHVGAVKSVAVTADGTLVTMEERPDVGEGDVHAGHLTSEHDTATSIDKEQGHSDVAVGDRAIALVRRDGSVLIASPSDTPPWSLPRVSWPGYSRRPGIERVAISRDGRHVVGVDPLGAVWYWHIADDPRQTTAPVFVTDFGMPIVSSRIEQSINGTTWLILGTSYKAAQLWTLFPEEPVQRQEFSPVSAVDISPGARWLAIATEHNESPSMPPTWGVQLWDLNRPPGALWGDSKKWSFEEKSADNPKGALLSAVTVSNDGTVVGGTTVGMIRLFGAHDHAPQSMQVSDDVIREVRMSADGRWLAASTQKGPVHLWDLANTTSRPSHPGADFDRWTLKAHDQPVQSMAFDSTSQYLVTGSGDRTTHVWDLKNPSPASELVVHRHGASGDEIGPQANLTQVVFSSDGQWQVSGTDRGDIELSSLTSTGRAFRLPLPDGFSSSPIRDIKVLPGVKQQSHVAALSSIEGHLTLWTLGPDPDKDPVVPRHTFDGVNAIGASPPYGAVSDAFGFAQGTSIHIWRLNQPEQSPEVLEAPAPVDRLDFSPDGRLVLVTTYPSKDHAAGVWLLRTGQPSSRPVALLPGTDSCRVGSPGNSMDRAMGRVTTVAFSREAAWLVVGTDRGGWLWEPDDANFQAPSSPGRSLASASCQEMAVAAFGQADSDVGADVVLTFTSDGTLQVAQVARDKVVVLNRYARPASRIVTLGSNRNGSLWFAGGLDGAVQLWKAADLVKERSKPAVFEEPPATRRSILAAAFAVTPDSLFTVNDGGITRKWPLRQKELLRLAAKEKRPHEQHREDIALVEDARTSAWNVVLRLYGQSQRILNVVTRRADSRNGPLD